VGSAQVIDALKSAAYELTALVLPGIVLVAIGHAFADTPLPASVPAWLIAGYVLGLVLQGIGAWTSRRRGLRRLVGATATRKISAAETRAKELVEKELGKDIADEHLLDTVLTRVHQYRQVYDKFLALADTARALALVGLIATVLVLIAYGSDLDTARAWLMLLGTIACWLALCERYHRFAPLALKALYGKYVALHGAPTTAAPSAASGHFSIFSVSGSLPSGTSHQTGHSS
jgi:hypothetical protein